MKPILTGLPSLNIGHGKLSDNQARLGKERWIRRQEREDARFDARLKQQFSMMLSQSASIGTVNAVDLLYSSEDASRTVSPQLRIQLPTNSVNQHTDYLPTSEANI